MSERSLIPIETKRKIEKALEFFNSLKQVKFSNDQEYGNGVGLCKSVKEHINVIEADRKLLVKPFNDQVTEINGECNGVIKKLQNAESVIKKGMAEYFATNERKRIEEQRKFEAEAEERRRQEVEKARKEAEKADRYHEQGREEMAEMAKARAETAAFIASNIVAPIAQNTAEAKGVSFTKKYKVNIIDLKKAVQACLNSNILSSYVNLDVAGIQRLANAQKGQISIDGLQITEDFQVGMRATF